MMEHDELVSADVVERIREYTEGPDAEDLTELELRTVILMSVSAERRRQEEICRTKQAEGLDWQSCSSTSLSNEAKLAILTEEVGEVARELCEARAAGEKPGDNLKVELIQIAAICVAWAEALS